MIKRASALISKNKIIFCELDIWKQQYNGSLMKSKIKKHVFGYDVFKENIPFSKLDKGDVLLNPHDEFKRNHNWSFLRMNDDYIELIDQSYARLGKSLSMFVFISPLIILLFGILFLFCFILLMIRGGLFMGLFYFLIFF